MNPHITYHQKPDNKHTSDRHTNENFRNKKERCNALIYTEEISWLVILRVALYDAVFFLFIQIFAKYSGSIITPWLGFTNINLDKQAMQNAAILDGNITILSSLYWKIPLVLLGSMAGLILIYCFFNLLIWRAITHQPIKTFGRAMITADIGLIIVYTIILFLAQLVFVPSYAMIVIFLLAIFWIGISPILHGEIVKHGLQGIATTGKIFSHPYHYGKQYLRKYAFCVIAYSLLTGVLIFLTWLLDLPEGVSTGLGIVSILLWAAWGRVYLWKTIMTHD